MFTPLYNSSSSSSSSNASSNVINSNESTTETDWLLPLLIDELLEVLKRDSSRAIQALQSPNVISKLSMHQLFEVIGAHPELAGKILENPGLLDRLSVEDLTILGKHTPKLASYFLEKRVYPTLVSDVRKMGGFTNDFKDLIYRFPEIASKILDTPELCDELEGRHLIVLGQSSLENAIKILDTPAFNDKLNKRVWIERQLGIVEPEPDKVGAFQRSEIGQYFPTIAKKLFDSPTFYNNAGGIALANVGRSNLEIAWHILKNPDLCGRLEGRDLSLLGSKHLEIAWHILKNPELCGKLDGYNLASLGKGHLEIAWHILKTPELSVKLMGNNLYYLSFSHFDLVSHLFKSPTLYEKLDSNDLVTFGKKYENVATFILKTPMFFNKLSNWDVVILGGVHHRIAKRILKGSEDILFDRSLSLLAESDLEVVLYILQSSYVDRLDGYRLADIGHLYFEAASYIMEKPELFCRLSCSDLKVLATLPAIKNRVLEKINASDSHIQLAESDKQSMQKEVDLWMAVLSVFNPDLQCENKTDNEKEDGVENKLTRMRLT